MVVPLSFGVVRPIPSSWIQLTRIMNPIHLYTRAPLSILRNGSTRFGPIFQASLHSSSASDSRLAQVFKNQPEIIFIGTGTSEGIPRVSCLTNPNKTCPVCFKAKEPGSRNKRLNTSLLIRLPRPLGECNILIDAGKYVKNSSSSPNNMFLDRHMHLEYGWRNMVFLSQCSEMVPDLWISARIRTIDAVIITHSHADAIGGLDDLRDWTNNVQPSVPIFTTLRDFEVMNKTHYYLVDKSGVTTGAAVSDLQFHIIQEEPFLVHDLQFIPLPVWHGRGYRSLGFRFGNICYISDVSEIPEDTYPLLENCEILILDALRPDRSSSTHFGLPQALEEVRKIRPKRTLFTGMMHLMDHDEVNSDLVKLKETEGLDVQLSCDGLRVPVSL